MQIDFQVLGLITSLLYCFKNDSGLFPTPERISVAVVTLHLLTLHSNKFY